MGLISRLLKAPLIFTLVCLSDFTLFGVYGQRTVGFLTSHEVIILLKHAIVFALLVLFLVSLHLFKMHLSSILRSISIWVVRSFFLLQHFFRHALSSQDGQFHLHLRQVLLSSHSPALGHILLVYSAEAGTSRNQIVFVLRPISAWVTDEINFSKIVDLC